jgi:D-glycerate 3-kinase
MKGDDELSLRQLFDQIDYLVYLRPPSFEVVAAWRQEQEDKLRAKLGQSDAVGLMDGRQIARFIQHYERHAPHDRNALTHLSISTLSAPQR